MKPSNVLITLHDGKPVPKVIDFGVAKATNQRLTERTVYTRFAQIIGTPIYMSPEQAELSGLDVDTRSDIYSLGVLLYELLTGTTPFDRERFAKAGYEEIRRVIREEEPPKPSTRVSSLGETATSVSAHRGTDPRSLSKFVTGDLDVIVMKAIEKDRTRRYDTASGLSEDVQRFLRDEPILARSPSLAYRFAKFASRYRVAMATSAFMLALLVLGIVATAWMAQVARREARRAEDANDRLHNEAEQKNETLRRLAGASYEEAVAKAIAGDNEGARKAVEVALEAGGSGYHVAVIEGLLALNDGRDSEAVRLAKEALADKSRTEGALRIGARALLATACQWAGEFDRWEQELHELRRLTPESETDHLLMAYALVLQDPPEALGYLEAKPRIERSPAGILIRGEANFLMGLDQQDAALIDEALRDLRYAQFFCQDSRTARGWRVLALAGAVELARLEGRPDDVTRFVKEGRPLAGELGAVTDYSWGDYCRWLFYLAAGGEKEAWLAIRRAGGRPGYYALSIAADCLRRHDVTIAADEFAKAMIHWDKHSRYLGLASAHLVPDVPDRAQRVRELVDHLVDDPSPLIRRHALSALCLVSSPDEIEKRASEATRDIWEGAYDEGDLFNGMACVRFLAGEDSEEDLLKGAGDHGYAKANAHFTIAMKRVAAKDRQGALEHFRSCAATHTIGSIDYELGRAYLTRMEKDSAWPTWSRGNVND